MIKISKRLQALARLVPAGSRVADIGTDHGLLPVYLVEEGVSPLVIGVDVHRGPYETACRNVRACLPAGAVDLRLGDGLNPLQPGEVDVVIIAGMGGAAMREILAQAPEAAEGLTRLILQPMNASEAIRRWLYEHGWVIVEEDLVSEKGQVYEIMAAEKGEAPSLSEEEACFGPLLIKNKHPLLALVLAKELSSLQEIISRLANSKTDEAKEKRRRLVERENMIKELLLWLSAVKE
ncbi:MAG: class I SAM-dependent methyltransferase [Peptococcaceae bacterium]|nr:class I SAM-dependent methyltransferase [Peptococcaceae bacterium]MDH7526277.1 class I SAM-dependent methyltransferase [Peptococcaceae bacterium]